LGPIATPAELAAQETLRDKIDDWDALHGWVGWALLVLSILMILSGLCYAVFS